MIDNFCYFFPTDSVKPMKGQTRDIFRVFEEVTKNYLISLKKKKKIITPKVNFKLNLEMTFQKNKDDK